MAAVSGTSSCYVDAAFAGGATCPAGSHTTHETPLQMYETDDGQRALQLMWKNISGIFQIYKLLCVYYMLMLWRLADRK